MNYIYIYKLGSEHTKNQWKKSHKNHEDKKIKQLKNIENEKKNKERERERNKVESRIKIYI
jgi:hypothetical protein